MFSSPQERSAFALVLQDYRKSLAAIFGRIRQKLLQDLGLRWFFLCHALIAALFAAAPVAAQGVSLGITGGVYPGADFEDQYIPIPPFPPIVIRSDSVGYVVGPSIELHLTRKFSTVFEALYKPLHYEESASFRRTGEDTYEVIGYAPATVVTWQFPLLFRYRFSLLRWRPFFEGGPSFRSTGNLNASNPSHFGVSVGAGLELRSGRFAVTPGIRYTHWQEDTWWTDVRTQPDQLEITVRLSWKLWGK